MSAISETIVREYFELHGFLLRQARKYVSQSRQEQDDDIDFFALNPHPAKREAPLPFILASAHIASIERAIVVVKAWHTTAFTPARMSHAPEIFRFVEPRAFRQAARAFGPEDGPLKILVVPELPHDETGRNQSIALLRSKGVDAVLLFRTVLQELISQVEVNRNYQKSDLLQVLRILKNYELLRDPQLELFKPKAPRRKASPRAPKL